MAFINILYNLWPDGDRHIPGLRDAIAAAAPSVFAKYGIDTALLVAHLMAQGSLECGAGLEVEEDLNYSPSRLPKVWPDHFNSNNAFIYAHNPQKLANYIYEPPLHNDLGNIAKSNDGWNFRGRGFSQTTGRAGYARLGDYLLKKSGWTVNLVDQPDLLNSAENFLECGVADFILCGCLPFAEANDVVGVTRHLNGGLTGLPEREQWLAKWKAALHGIDFPLAESAIS
jgi:putative chitinase